MTPSSPRFRNSWSSASSTDSITLPLLAQFAETAEYYGTAFHEMVHSTGHMKRLNRLDATAFFGSDAYSKEELVAEIGAAALVNRAGLETSNSFTNSAAPKHTNACMVLPSAT